VAGRFLDAAVLAVEVHQMRFHRVPKSAREKVTIKTRLKHTHRIIRSLRDSEHVLFASKEILTRGL
jgi:hypothetical protein